MKNLDPEVPLTSGLIPSLPFSWYVWAWVFQPLQAPACPDTAFLQRLQWERNDAGNLLLLAA